MGLVRAAAAFFGAAVVIVRIFPCVVSASSWCGERARGSPWRARAVRVRPRPAAALSECGAPMQVQLVHEAPVDECELRVAGELDDAIVEGDVRVVVAV